MCSRSLRDIFYIDMAPVFPVILSYKVADNGMDMKQVLYLSHVEQVISWWLPIAYRLVGWSLH